MRRAAPVIVLCALGLAACGEKTVKQHEAEKTVTRFVFVHTGFRAKDVSCPSGVAAKVGRTYDCQFTGPEGPYVAHVRITSVHGSRVGQYITTHPRPGSGRFPRTVSVPATERTVAAFVRRRTGTRPKAMSCPPGIPPHIGIEFDCHFQGPDGRYVAHVRIAKIHGDNASYAIVTRRIS